MKYKPAGKLGTGARFAAVEKSIAKNPNIRNPAAVAASIGRKKYGAHKMAQMATRERLKNKMGV
jgi:hypothetical protein